MSLLSDTHVLIILFIVIVTVVSLNYTGTEHIVLFGMWGWLLSKGLRVRYTTTSYKNEQREIFNELLGDVQAGALKDMEPPKMMNKLINEFWPTMAVAVADNLRSTLDSSLEQYKPGFLSKLAVQTCSCGPKAPVFQGMKITTEQNTKLGRAVLMDMKMHWCGDPDIVLEVDGSAIPHLFVSLDDFSLSGLMRMKFYPMCDNWPLFTAMGVQFLSPPIINFTLKVKRAASKAGTGGGLDIMSLPYLAPYLTRTLQRDIINNMMLFPKWMHFPIGPVPDGWELGYQVAVQGIVVVRLVEGRGMTVGGNGKFRVNFFVGVDDEGVISREVKQGVCPVWNEIWGLIVHGKEFQQLRLEVQEDGQAAGQGQSLLDKLKPDYARETWCNINPLKKDGKIDATKKCGQIRLQMLWLEVDPTWDTEEIQKRRTNTPNINKELEQGLQRMREAHLSGTLDPDEDVEMSEEAKLKEGTGFLKPRIRRHLASLLDQPPSRVFNAPQDPEACRRWKNLHSGKMTLDTILSSAKGHCIQEGNLWKLNPNSKTFSTWKIRYFIIVDDFMVYFESRGHQEKASGCVYLRGAGVSQLEEVYGKRNAIRIMSCTPRRPNEKFTNFTNRHHFTVAVENIKEYNLWFDAILERAKYDILGNLIDQAVGPGVNASGAAGVLDGEEEDERSHKKVEDELVRVAGEEREEGENDDDEWYSDWWQGKEIICPPELQSRYEVCRILSDPVDEENEFEDEFDLDDIELDDDDLHDLETEFQQVSKQHAIGGELGADEMYALKKRSKDKKKEERRKERRERKEKRNKKKDKKEREPNESVHSNTPIMDFQFGSTLGIGGPDRIKSSSNVSMTRGGHAPSIFSRGPTASSLGGLGDARYKSPSYMRPGAPSTLGIEGGHGSFAGRPSMNRSAAPSMLSTPSSVDSKKGSFFGRSGSFWGAGAGARRPSNVGGLPGADEQRKSPSKSGLWGRRVSVRAPDDTEATSPRY